jgi:hypothetical protein
MAVRDRRALLTRSARPLPTARVSLQMIVGDLQPDNVLDISGAVPEDRLVTVFDVCRKSDMSRLQVPGPALRSGG